MKVVLIQNIPGLGHLGEVKEVSDGYAVNYLLPEQKAWLATPANVGRIQKKHAPLAHKDISYAHLSAVLHNQALNFSKKVSDKNKLFEAVQNNDIVQAILEKFNLIINPKWLHNFTALKVLGEHQVAISLPNKEKILIKIIINKQE